MRRPSVAVAPLSSRACARNALSSGENLAARAGRFARVACIAVLLLAACDRAPADTVENATPSPNASILPAPLSSTGQAPVEAPTPGAPRSPGHAAETSGRALSLEGGAAPQVLRGDQPPDDDPLPTRELPGVTLEAEWRWSDMPAPPKSPEVNAAGIDVARKLVSPRMTIELAAAGRMRMTFASRGLPLRQGSEIRARTDRHGHLLVWPEGTQYRVLPPGAVRTLFSERRVDAIPLVRPESVLRSDGPRRLGFPTKKRELATRSGKLLIEQARLPNAGESGDLLCRFLTELIAIAPSAGVCAGDDVPLRAQFTWPQGGSVSFEIIALSEKAELNSTQLFTPPSGSEFTVTGLPPDSGSVFLTSDELSVFRNRPIEGNAPSVPGAPRDGLLVHNATDLGRYLFLDGVPVAWVPPNRDQLVLGPPRGRYQLAWRTFLGEGNDVPIQLETPVRISIGPSVDGGRER